MQSQDWILKTLCSTGKPTDLQAEDLQGAAWIWEAFVRYIDANILYMVCEPKVKESAYKQI